jgi:hypothetical protein
MVFFLHATPYGQLCPVSYIDPDPDCEVSTISAYCTMGTHGTTDENYCDEENLETYMVKIYLNVVRKSDGTGGKTWSSINSDIQEMIDAFMPLGILFSIEGRDSIENTTIYDYTYFYTSGSNQLPNGTQIQALYAAKNHPNAIDLYFTGLATLPGGFAEAPSTPSDAAAVIDRDVSAAVLIHEMGHVFGLFHTFFYCDLDELEAGSPCLTNPTPCSCGDFVTDTNFDTQDNTVVVLANGDCEIDLSTSGGVPNAPYSNYMSYAPDVCRNNFTNGQRRRMKRYLENCPKLTDVALNGPISISSGMNLNFEIHNSFLYPNFDECLPGFIIGPNATLNINSDLQFSTSAKILVKAGGRLNVNGVTLSTCGDEWTGIEVEGNPGLGQFPTTNQGRVNLYEGTVLEYARKPLYVSGGGIVLADETIFSNCGTSTFNSYPKPSFSRFTDCQFVNDDDDINFQFTSNVFLAGINGVQFSNCDFDVSGISSIFSGSDRPTGISALNARFGVGSGSSFTGYYTGIRAIGVGSKASVGFNVNGASFSDNFIGIDNSNVDNATIRSCTFSNIGGYSGDISTTGVKPVGVQLKNCTAFQVTDNNFSGSSADYEIGMLAYNTGSDVNILRRNTFTGLYTANQAELDNRGTTFDEGLQYWCNTNSTTRFDFAVFDKGIGQEQGGLSAVKNIFSNYNNVDGDFQNNSTGDINYHYRDITNEKPIDYSNIVPVEESNTNIVLCTDIIDHTEEDGVLDGDDGDFLDSVFTTVKATYLTQLSIYNSLHGNSTAIAMEPGLAAQKAVLHVVTDRIIRSELSDTTEIDLDHIRTWLRNKESRESEYGIVEAWLSESDSAHAVQVLDSIPRKYRFSAIDSTRHNLYKDWVLLRIGFEREEKSIYRLDSLDIEDVEDIAEADTVSLASAQARALLDGIYGYDYRIHPKKANTGGSGIMAPPTNGNIAVATTNAQVTAFPNPAKDVVKFKYKSDKVQGVTWLTIHDINGRMIAQMLLTATDNSVEWRTDGLSAGVYYYKVTGVGNLPKKLVLIK